MKTLFAILALCLHANISQAAVNFDGCYQLYLPGSMYPSFCLDGTQEEGIGGAGARLVIFHTNSDSISACAVSSSLVASANSMDFILGNKTELVLTEAKVINSRLEGTATFGNTILKFVQINDSVSKRLLSKLYSETKCQQVEMGEIVRL